jgi:hypothetical protein
MTEPNRYDLDFEERTIDRVEGDREKGWWIHHGGLGFHVPADSPVEPKAGMVARFYGGAGAGCIVRGLTLDGVPVFYRTPEEEAARREEQRRQYEEERKRVALEPINPERQVEGFEWTADMRQISGFGGGYERTCRAMVSAGCKWWSEHPDAKPEFHGYRNVFGVCTEDNDDAKALTAAILEAANGDATGAMHQAAVSHIFAWRHFGSWLAYQAKMRELKREEGEH